jgi:hypothetical protein
MDSKPVANFGVSGLIIVIPMAGRSQRFRNAGYEQPKFMLPLQGATMFDHAVASFRRYFDTATFFFVTRDQGHADFAVDHARTLGIKETLTAIDPNPTGLANTVFAGLASKPSVTLDQAVLIQVLDTFRPEFRLPEDVGRNGFAEFCLTPRKTPIDRFLQLPKEPPQGQSHVFPLGLSLARLRGTGLYYTPSAERLMKAFQRMKEKGERACGFQQSFRKFGAPEEFVEGLSLIRSLHRLGQKTQLRLVHRDDVIFCGVPREYKALCNHWPKGRAVPLSEDQRKNADAV